MNLTDRQRQQADALASLLTQPDRSSITQGIELVTALGDQALFEELLDGAAAPPVDAVQSSHRRFATVERATLFDQKSGKQAWLDLAMVHLLAASELPLRSAVKSLALGTPTKRYRRPAPTLWLDGLERFESLTHLDLHMTSIDQDLDLSPLAEFPKLTHLRIRGDWLPGWLPSLPHLVELDALKVRFAPDASYPALERIRVRIENDVQLTPTRMPRLVEVEARGKLQIDGFESLQKLWCHRGVVEATGLRRVENLRLSADRFDAPDLTHVGLLERASPGFSVSQLETLDEVKMHRTSRFTGGTFPEGTRLGEPKVLLWGPLVTDLGNMGELTGLEFLSITRAQAPLSLETLRNAKDLRVLDIRFSTGITDLSPLEDLPNLEALIINDPERFDLPPRLEKLVEKRWRQSRRLETAVAELNQKD